MLVFAAIAVFSYLLSLSLIVPGLVRKQRGYRRLAIFFCCHRVNNPCDYLKAIYFSRYRRSKFNAAQSRICRQFTDVYHHDCCSIPWTRVVFNPYYL